MGMNENYTPQKWTKKRYEQCVKELCEVINTQNKHLRAYKDKEDKINSSELMEVLADIEHKRWSGWQEYLHSLCVKNEDGSLTIPKERVDWWNKEIETPYCDLEERLKEYDRDEVRKTLSAILQILNEGDK